jgi:hypothetical protein
VAHEGDVEVVLHLRELRDEQLSADIAEAHRVVGRLSERGVVRKDNRELQPLS